MNRNENNKDDVICFESKISLKNKINEINYTERNKEIYNTHDNQNNHRQYHLISRAKNDIKRLKQEKEKKENLSVPKIRNFNNKLRDMKFIPLNIKSIREYRVPLNHNKLNLTNLDGSMIGKENHKEKNYSDEMCDYSKIGRNFKMINNISKSTSKTMRRKGSSKKNKKKIPSPFLFKNRNQKMIKKNNTTNSHSFEGGEGINKRNSPDNDKETKQIMNNVNIKLMKNGNTDIILFL